MTLRRKGIVVTDEEAACVSASTEAMTLRRDGDSVITLRGPRLSLHGSNDLEADK